MFSTLPAGEIQLIPHPTCRYVKNYVIIVGKKTAVTISEEKVIILSKN